MSTADSELEEKPEEHLLKLSTDIANFWNCQLKVHLENTENSVNETEKQLTTDLLTTTDNFILKLETTFNDSADNDNPTELFNLQKDLENVLNLIQRAITESALPPPEFVTQNRSLQLGSLLALYSSTLPNQPINSTNSLFFALGVALNRTKAQQKVKLEQRKTLGETLSVLQEKLDHFKVCLEEEIGVLLNFEKKAISCLIEELLQLTEETANQETLEKLKKLEAEKKETPEAILASTQWITFYPEEEKNVPNKNPRKKSANKNSLLKLICHPKSFLRQRLGFGL